MHKILCSKMFWRVCAAKQVQQHVENLHCFLVPVVHVYLNEARPKMSKLPLPLVSTSNCPIFLYFHFLIIATIICPILFFHRARKFLHFILSCIVSFSPFGSFNMFPYDKISFRNGQGMAVRSQCIQRTIQ